MNTDPFEVQPLTVDRWQDLEIVFGASGMGGCWCMYWFSPTSKAWGEGTKGGRTAPNKKLFRSIIEAGPPPGLIAYKDGEPVGWCRVTPRASLPGLANSRHFKTELDIENVWSLSCFVVRRAYRGRGLTTVLTNAAIAFARENQANFLEVYPTDTDKVKHPSVIYTGVASTFIDLGFKEVQRRSSNKPMMRLAL